MAIIDFHTHFFPDKLYQAIWNWLEGYRWDIQHKVFADELIQKLKSIGISKMVLLNYAHKPGMSRTLNQWTREFADRQPDVIPFGTVHPHDEDRDETVTQCFEDFGFYGLKLHAAVTGIPVDDPVFFPIYEKTEEAGKILMLHAGTGPRLVGSVADSSGIAGLKRVKAILERYPNLKLVIPHLGTDEMDEFFDLMEEHNNLWMDTAMTLAEFFPLKPALARIEKLSDRLLYGSDAPNIPYPLETEMNNIKKWFSVDVQEKLFFKNARNLLALDS